MADEPRTSERQLRRRYDQMGEQRVAAMRQLARRDAALAILDDQGTVSAEEVDRRMDATFTEPDEQTLANLLAQKAAAAVDYTQRQLDAERSGVERTEAKRDTIQGHLDANAAEITEAQERVAGMETQLAEAEAMARFAGAKGDAAQAPVGSAVDVDATTADTDAQGG